VGRIDLRVVGQRKQLPGQAVVERAGVARLEVGAAAAVDQQGIAGEDAAHDAVGRGLFPQVAHAAGGVPGRMDGAQHLFAEGDSVAVDQLLLRGLDIAAGRRRSVRAGLQRKVAGRGDVVGMGMGLDDPRQPRAG